MNASLFESLLFEEESTTLDFKQGQYRFAKATDDEKSELLKDILGFANAWRRADAYILIGVRELRGQRSQVIGISAQDHLDDHSLQQFVSNLTNRPVRFHYEAYMIDGKQVGIIRVETQSRPIYLKKDYGTLSKNDVYVRRGSSTDPTKPATPEEIALMGSSMAPDQPRLRVEFADLNVDESLGNEIHLQSVHCRFPGPIPSLTQPRYSPFDEMMSIVHQPNKEFYREMAAFIVQSGLLRPVRLVIHNVGEIVAKNVRIEIRFLKEHEQNSALTDDDRLSRPSRDHLHSFAMDVRPSPVGRQKPGQVVIRQDSTSFVVEVDCATLQPDRRVWSEVFFLARLSTGTITLEGHLFADDLARPSDVVLMCSFAVEDVEVPLDLLKREAAAEDFDD